MVLGLIFAVVLAKGSILKAIAMIVLGNLGAPDGALHVAVLLVYVVAGALIARPLLTRRLVK